MTLPLAIATTPLHSPSGRRCRDCSDIDLMGQYGPEALGKVAYSSGYRQEWLADSWFCSPCGDSRWMAWHDPERVHRRRAWVLAEVERRRVVLLERFGPAQMTMFREAR